MPATELLCRIIGINPQKLSKKENLILELELFSRLCKELTKELKTQFKGYFNLIHLTLEIEDNMIEAIFMRSILNDLITTGAYTIPGIAIYTQHPEEVIYDVASGHNRNPTLSLSRKIIELHRVARPEIYRKILSKIIKQDLSLEEDEERITKK